MRSNLAGLSINYNDKFNTRLRAAITHKSPSSHTKKFAERLAKRRDKNRCRKRLYVPNNPRNLIKKEGMKTTMKIMVRIYMPLTLLRKNLKKTAFLSSLQKTEEKVIQLSRATVEQTTSFGKICKMRATTDPKKKPVKLCCSVHLQEINLPIMERTMNQ
jgi:hypothetical protein